MLMLVEDAVVVQGIHDEFSAFCQDVKEEAVKMLLTFVANRMSQGVDRVVSVRDLTMGDFGEEKVKAAVMECWSSFDMLFAANLLLLNRGQISSFSKAILDIREIVSRSDLLDGAEGGLGNDVENLPFQFLGLVVRDILQRSSDKLESWRCLQYLCAFCVRSETLSPGGFDLYCREISLNLQTLRATVEDLRLRTREFGLRVASTLWRLICTRSAFASSVAVTSVSAMPSGGSVSTGCTTIDQVIGAGGGFRKGQVSHVFGEAGSGKSQLGLSTLVDCASRGSGAVNLVSEDFPQSRLREITEHAARQAASGFDAEPGDMCEASLLPITTSILERIYVRKVQSMTHLLEVLGSNGFTSFLSANGVAVVVLDSFAGASEPENTQKRPRSSYGAPLLGKDFTPTLVASALNDLAARVSTAAFVVLNQVRADTRHEMLKADGLDYSFHDLLELSGGHLLPGLHINRVLPAMAPHIAHFAHAQLFLCKVASVSAVSPTTRMLISLNSPDAPSGRTALFQIAAEGLL